MMSNSLQSPHMMMPRWLKSPVALLWQSRDLSGSTYSSILNGKFVGKTHTGRFHDSSHIWSSSTALCLANVYRHSSIAPFYRRTRFGSASVVISSVSTDVTLCIIHLGKPSWRDRNARRERGEWRRKKEVQSTPAVVIKLCTVHATNSCETEFVHVSFFF